MDICYFALWIFVFVNEWGEYINLVWHSDKEGIDGFMALQLRLFGEL